LTNVGVRVITVDFYGRGRSPWPGRRLVCSVELLVNQVYELVNTLKIDSFALLGISLGAAVAVRFAAEYPDMVKSLVLLAPAGLPVVKSKTTKALECCCLGSFIMCCMGGRM